MPDYSDLDKLFSLVEAVRAREAARTGDITYGVTDEEREHCRRWADGQEIQTIVNYPGYEILIGKLQKFMEDDIQTLMSTSPGSNDAVLANHAVAYSSHKTFFRLQAEVNTDLEAAKVPPEIVKQGIRLTRGIPPESA